MALSPAILDHTHAISRTAEFLSVAKTSLRILQQNPDVLHPDLQRVSPNDLRLHHEQINPSNAAIDALDEAALTLKLLDSTLETLRNLVKRRGATNDPTEQINEAIASFHSYSKGILEVVQNSIPQSAVLSPYEDVIVRSTSQRLKHYEIVANVLRKSVEKRNEEFKSIMTLRGDILKEQTLRRKKLLSLNDARSNGTMGSNENSNAAMAPSSGGVRLSKVITPVGTEGLAKRQMASPLFTAVHSNGYGEQPTTRQQISDKSHNGPNSKTGPVTANNTIYKQHTAPNIYGVDPKVGASNPYGVGYGSISAKYGGTNHNPYNAGNSFGVRRRAGGSSALDVKSGYDPYQEEESKIHNSNSVMAQIQMRRESRQTQRRLESARQAEKSLAELTTMFSKMSNLIHSQGETLMKIEDDVEAAMDHVEAGREEIVKLYEWTKGNRGLIIKVFALLIFFVVFMRFYG